MENNLKLEKLIKKITLFITFVSIITLILSYNIQYENKIMIMIIHILNICIFLAYFLFVLFNFLSLDQKKLN